MEDSVITEKESQEPFSRPAASQQATEKEGRTPGEQAAGARLRGEIPAVLAAEQWERTFDAVPDLVAILDTQFRIVRINKAMADRLDLAKAQCVGQSCYRLVHGTNKPPPFCPQTRLLQDGEEHAIEVHEERLAADFLVSVSPLRDSAGHLVGSVHVARDITERKRAREALRESREAYRATLETTGTAMLIGEEDTIISMINAEFEKLCGYSKGEVEGKKSWLEFIAKADLERLKKYHHLRMVDPSAALPYYEFQLVDKQGRVKDILITLDLIPGTTRTVGSLLDITERKRAERELRESEARFSELFSNMSSGVAVYEAVDDGSDFVFKDFNKAGERIECITKEKVIGRRVTEAFPGVKEFGLLDVLQEVWRTGTPQLHPISVYKDERIVGWRENYVYRLPSGEVVAVYDDITARKQAENDLVESESKLRAVFENAGGAIFIADIGTGKILDCNLQAEKLLGRSRAELIGMHQSQLHPEGEEEKYRQKFATHVKKGHTVDHEGEAQHSDGRRIPVWIAGQIMKLHDREVVIGLFLDITERKRTEKRLREGESRQAEMEKQAATGRLAAEIAHEINSPLAGIKNCFALVKDGIAEDYPHYDLVELIDREIDRIARIVRQMYRLHSSDQSPVFDVSIGDTVRDIVSLLETSCREQEVQIEAMIDPPDMTARLPDGDLRQVLYNLLTNAVDASPLGGVVKITAGRVEDTVVITVSDRGHGIPEEARDRIFEPHFTTKCSDSKERMGLGLHISRDIVENLNGTLSFGSSPDKGTVFEIVLPTQIS